MKNFLKKIFKGDETKTDEQTMLFEKWLKNPLVKEWDKKGWLKEERPEVLSYMIYEWERRGEPVPGPNSFKAKTVEEYGKKYGYEILIETGTFRGTMINAQKDNFKKIMSIEIDKKFHADAVEKFKAFSHIKFCLGDSGKLLKEIMNEIDKPAIFWLDAHYNGKSDEKLETECPIYGEIDAVFGAKKLKHVMLIDDARLFIGEKDYPTIKELSDYITKKEPGYKVEVKNDIIRVEPVN
jgi:hypothetical protein